MSFVAALGLLVGVLAFLPYLAHRLRRERADERRFAFTEFVPPLPPKARRRSMLEDRALFAVRALSVLAIALLAATPLVRCDRIALSRRDGASVALAIVLDDSLSMRVRPGGGTSASRFAEAKAAALTLVRQTQDGDSLTLLAGGFPARRILAPTTDRAVFEDALEALTESDRATDLEGAIALAKSSLAGLPQIDKRTLVFSDRADGNPDGPELGKDDETISFPLPQLAGEVPNCAVLSASRQLSQVKARLRCGGGGTLDGRTVSLRSGERTLVTVPAGNGTVAEVVVPIAAAAAGETDLEVTLDDKDVLRADDHAPAEGGSGQALLGIVSARRDESLATGGSPVVERALAALRLPLELRPLPLLPDSVDDLSAFAGMVLDDPSGLTPEERVGLQRYLADGRTLLLALGPRAHSAPLGATFEPILAGRVSYKPSPVAGADPSSLVGPLAESKDGFSDLALQGRATLEDRDLRDFDVLAKFQDGAPLVLRKTVGRGVVWVVTLPFSLDESDFPLRPGFLDLLQEFAEGARERGSFHRTHPGEAWFLRGATRVRGTDPLGKPIVARNEPGGVVVDPALIGRYRIVVEGPAQAGDAPKNATEERPETMGTLVDPRELDLRPRAAVAALDRARQSGSAPRIDVSWAVALVVLGLMVAELALRVVLGRRNDAAARELVEGAS